MYYNVLNIGGQLMTNFSMQEFKMATKNTCDMDYATLDQTFETFRGPEEVFMKLHCFKSVYSIVLLENIFGFEVDRGVEIIPTRELAGQKIDWTNGPWGPS